jgi:DNA invertase Pin-like site-specific DNA recombinase
MIRSNPAPKALRTAAVYARVSTDRDPQEARKRRQEVENQLRQLREYCARQGWQLDDEHVYIDKLSGKRADNRKEFRRMFADASQRKFDVVVVWALDRFTREGVHQTFDHIRTLSGYGVEFESLTEPHFRTTGAAGELMIAVAAWIGKQERLRISERVKAGMARAKAGGKEFGRPRKIIDRAKVRELHRQGLGARRIARALGATVDGGIAHTTIIRILREDAA